MSHESNSKRTNKQMLGLVGGDDSSRVTGNVKNELERGPKQAKNSEDNRPTTPTQSTKPSSVVPQRHFVPASRVMPHLPPPSMDLTCHSPPLSESTEIHAPVPLILWDNLHLINAKNHAILKQHTLKPSSYPDRAFVPFNKDWMDPTYKPSVFTHPIVTGGLSANKPSWADDAVFGIDMFDIFDNRFGTSRDGKVMSVHDAYLFKDGMPRNPAGPTGTTGRGLLGRYGPNAAVDVVLMVKDEEGLKVLVCEKNDVPMGESNLCLPGGMVESGRDVLETIYNELTEEAVRDSTTLVLYHDIDESTIHLMSCEDNTLIWSSKADEYGMKLLYSSSPDGKEEMLIGTSEHIIMLELTTGRQRWVFEHPYRHIWRMLSFDGGMCMLSTKRENAFVLVDFSAAIKDADRSNAVKNVALSIGDDMLDAPLFDMVQVSPTVFIVISSKFTLYRVERMIDDTTVDFAVVEVRRSYAKHAVCQAHAVWQSHLAYLDSGHLFVSVGKYLACYDPNNIRDALWSHDMSDTILDMSPAGRVVVLTIGLYVKAIDTEGKILWSEENVLGATRPSFSPATKTFACVDNLNRMTVYAIEDGSKVVDRQATQHFSKSGKIMGVDIFPSGIIAKDHSIVRDIFKNHFVATVYTGFVDDARNTDIAWMETTAKLYFITKDLSSMLNLNTRDKKEIGNVKWKLVKSIKSMYGSHLSIVNLSIKYLVGHI